MSTSLSFPVPFFLSPGLCYANPGNWIGNEHGSRGKKNKGDRDNGSEYIGEETSIKLLIQAALKFKAQKKSH